MIRTVARERVLIVVGALERRRILRALDPQISTPADGDRIDGHPCYQVVKQIDTKTGWRRRRKRRCVEVHDVVVAQIAQYERRKVVQKSGLNVHNLIFRQIQNFQRRLNDAQRYRGHRRQESAVEIELFQTCESVEHIDGNRAELVSGEMESQQTRGARKRTDGGGVDPVVLERQRGQMCYALKRCPDIVDSIIVQKNTVLNVRQSCEERRIDRRQFVADRGEL